MIKTEKYLNYTFRESGHRDRLDREYMRNIAGTVHCPKCGSVDVDSHCHIFRSPDFNAGYVCREYRMGCNSCGYQQKQAYESLLVAITALSLDCEDD